MLIVKFWQAHPLLVRLICFIFIPLFLLAIWCWQYLQNSLPTSVSHAQLSGLSASVTLNRDEHGLMQIKAKTDQDAYFALGYAHASDRLWQLELQKRIASGRLSEVFGKSALQQDAWLRTLGLRLSAESAWTALSPAAQQALQSYTRGINSGISQQKVLPPEFLLLNIKPEPWDVLDSLAWMKVFALNLSSNMWSELNNLIAAQTLSPAQAASFMPQYPKDAPTTITGKSGAALAQLTAMEQQLQALQIGGRFVGSNAWVVSGKHTANGKAILANDPHLGLQIPSLWYAVSVQGDRLDARGMSLIGLPLVIFGRNKQISWGGTNMMADAQDLNIEQLNAADQNQYRSLDQWQNFKQRKEFIQVKAESPASMRVPLAPVELRIRQTVNGPVISDVVPGFDQAVSLRWSALDEKDTTFEAFFQLAYANDWAQFRQALSFHVAPALNMLYSDTAGNIGYHGAGRIPIRAKGQGMLPVLAASEGAGWLGYIPFAQLPMSYNPTEGYLVSANNKVAADDYPHFISNEWAGPARAARIGQLLKEKLDKGQKVDTAYSMQMQLDQTDLSMLEIKNFLISAKAQFPAHQQELLDVLKPWDGRVNADSHAAALMHVWVKFIRQELYVKQLHRVFGQQQKYTTLKKMAEKTSHRQLINDLTRTNAWCMQASAQQKTPLPECSAVLRSSLTLAVAELELFMGKKPSKWRWGDIHQVDLPHRPFSQVNLADRLFGRKFESGGSADSINVANANYVELEGYVTSFGAGFRQVISLGPQEESEHFYANSGGQSGNLLSKHYDDLTHAYAQGQFFRFPTNGSHISSVQLSPLSKTPESQK